jgi:hypothetical protein
VAPCAIVVPPESPVRRAEDLAGVPIGVGYHSGSRFTTVQALETVLAPEDVSLTFQGPPNERLDTLLDRQVPAATLFGVPLYIAEAFGFRKVPSWRPRQRLAPERIRPCDSAEGPIWRPATRTLKHRPLPLGIHSPGTRCPCAGRRWVRCPCTRPMGMRRLARA